MPTSSKKHTSYKPKTVKQAIARKQVEQAVNKAAQAQEQAPSRVEALPPAGALEALHITLQPGSEFRIDFGLAFGRVVLRYPLDADPQLIIQPDPDGEAACYQFHRMAAVTALVGELGGGQG